MATNLIAESADPTVPGVLAENTAGGDGVRGNSASGRGVLGVSDTNHGVFGISKTAHGVHGDSNSGPGVVGASNTFIGVSGICQTGGVGVLGESNSGDGVFGATKVGVAVHGRGGRLAGFFEGSVEITGSLTIKGVSVDALVTQITSLIQQVNSLTGRIASLERASSGGGGNASDFVIGVAVEQGQFVVSGPGFRPNVKCFIIVTFPDFSRRVFEETAGFDGKLNFKVNTSSLCTAGSNLTLNFMVNQPDASGRDKFTNIFSKSCPA